MKYLERWCAAIMFLKVGFVVFAIFFCCFVLEPEQTSVADLVYADDPEDHVTPIVITSVNAHAQAHSKFRLTFAILAPSYDLIRQVAQQPKVVIESLNLQGFFLSFPTINAP